MQSSLATKTPPPEVLPASTAAPSEKFLINNWRQIMANGPRGLGCFSVDREVATICTTRLVIRCPFTVADGFYVFGRDDKPAPVLYRSWQGYPHPRSMWEDFAAMRAGPQIHRGLCESIIVWLEQARRTKEDVMLDEHGAFLRDGSAHFNFAELSGVPLPIAGEEIRMDPLLLKLAFTEMLRYDFFYILRSMAPEREGRVPLVLGHNWDQCAMIYDLRHW